MQAFNKHFMIGAATAAHQVEGNNIHSDYWLQEHMPHTSFAEPSGEACNHYNRYEEDIKIMAAAGLNAYRFSIEWARVEPEEGRFDPSEIEHYRNVIRCCKENGLEPIVTLLHFTSPAWLIKKGGWEAESTIADFRRYATYVMEQLGGELRCVCTINEANMGLQLAAIARRFQLMAQQAAKAQAGDAKKAEGTVQVGITLSMHDLQALPGGERFARAAWDEEFRHYLPYIRDDDFLGVQNYTRTQYGPEGQLPAPEGAELTQMDYEFYPEALEHVIRRVAEDFKGDIIVTENGIATADDARRVEFIRRALAGVQNCIADGLPIKGYFYWSLMDNFEWQKGFAMQFGLIAVDRANGQTRTAKPSLAYLGSCRG